MIFDPPQLGRVIPSRVIARKTNRLVAHDSGRLVSLTRVHSGKPQVLFSPDDKESSGAVDGRQPLIINIATIHYVAGARLNQQFVQDIHLMHRAVGNAYKRWDIAL